MTAAEQHAYVVAVVAAYRCVPGARGVARPADRKLAADLARRGIPRVVVFAGFLLAASRRMLRNAGADPLPPISSLHYFRPVLDEILAAPLDPDYVDYLRRKLRPLAPALVAATDPRFS